MLRVGACWLFCPDSVRHVMMINTVIYFFNTEDFPPKYALRFNGRYERAGFVRRSWRGLFLHRVTDCPGGTIACKFQCNLCNEDNWIRGTCDNFKYHN